MKKNKTIAYMLAATLLVGGTFAGTKAWFADGETVDSDLVIATGNIEVTTDADKTQWEPAGETESIKGNDGRFTNVRPGDKFKKSIRISNTGSLSQKLKITGGEDGFKSDNFNITNTMTQGDKNRILGPGENVEFEIQVEVLGDKMGNESSSSKAIDLKNYMKTINIEAKQVNEK